MLNSEVLILVGYFNSDFSTVGCGMSVIELQKEETGEKAVSLTWERREVAGTMISHPGGYCLRSNEIIWDAEKLWRTYIMLTDLEAVFRSLKSELGLRPVFHHKEARVDGLLFIKVLAYQLVQVHSATSP